MTLATPASAEWITLRFENPGETQTYEAVKLCNETECLSEIAVICGPGETCSVDLDHPHGYHLLRIEARDHLLSNWSSPSNEIRRAIPRVGWPYPAVPVACKSDINGNGLVQGDDFSLLLRTFGQSCSTPIAVLP